MRCLALLLLFTSVVAFADEKPLVPEGAKVEKLWSKGTFTEGPAHGPDGCIYFTDIGNAIMKYHPDHKLTTVHRANSGKANGLDFDPEGRLVACEGAGKGGNRRITRTERDGVIVTLAEKWQGKRFNSPNDLTIDVKGRIYFTDPRYSGDDKREIDRESVYMIGLDGKVLRVIIDVEKPNGILLSPDMKTLYVADSNPTGKRQLLAFAVDAGGKIGAKKVLHDFAPDRGIDGMCADEKGRIYAAAGRQATAGIHVFSPEGKKLHFIPVPELPTNCVFAGKDRSMLYITAGKSLYRIKLNTRGFAVYWPEDK